MLERSFLDALRSDPNDDLARVTYMDWLDEQGDERGELLRGELAGVGLARLSAIAAAADPEWLAVASLMARRVEAAWRVARPAFAAVAPAADPITWPEARDGIAEAFAALRHPRDEDFLVPYDFALFQTMYPGGWFRDGGPRLEQSLWAPSMVLERTREWYDEDHIADVDVGPDDLWLSIATPWSIHHEQFLCCSAASRHFGSVVLHDDDGHPVWAASSAVASSYLEFLRRLAPPRDRP